ncbi:hypothetical protein AB0M32_25570 [Streptomyces sp. NPDC051985]|uniref:hypothetical protein n=1 Tax=Streptomyces sp. NPDC051985 TaxID=3155807 RepID=UPI003425F794
MVRLVAQDDTRVSAVTVALAPYAWQGFTAEAVARRVLAALDPHRIEGDARVARQDERIAVLTRFLAGCQWRSLTAAGLGRHLVTALDAWRQDSQWLEIRLNRDAEGRPLSGHPAATGGTGACATRSRHR